MRVFSVIASVILILVPVFGFVNFLIRGWKVSQTRRDFVMVQLIPNLLTLAATMALLWGAGVFRNFT